MGLFDYEFQLEKIKAHNPPLQRLDRVIDWEGIFREILEEGLKKEDRKSKAGRKSYDKILMFKILILQRYYNLSDAQTEFQIKDRLSFQHFLGLEFGEEVPDEKTIWLFRERLTERGLSETLFALFTSTLIEKGIVAKEGSLVDASFATVPKQHNRREENAQIKAGEVPESFEENPHKRSQKDCDARWTKKNNQRVFGFKNHINADQKTKIITRFSVTPASTHDSQVIEELVDETDQTLYTDSAYHSKEIEEYLEENNVRSRGIKRSFRNRPLSSEEKKLNYKHSKTRSRVEHIFGTIKHQMHNALHLRCIGMKRIKAAIGLVNLTYNLLRYEQLVRLYGAKRI